MKVTTINKNIKDNRINFKVQVNECDEYSWFDNGFYFGWVDKDLSNYYVAFIDEQENKRVVATKKLQKLQEKPSHMHLIVRDVLKH